MRSGNLQRAVRWVWPTTNFKHYTTTDRSEDTPPPSMATSTHGHHAEDATEYPKEGLDCELEGTAFPCSPPSGAAGFATSTIVKAVASAGVIAAFYKYAPSASDDNIITRYISSNATPSEVWEKVNIKHAILEQQQADDSQILWSAQKPPVHRYRYPQCVRLSLCSPGPMLIRTLVDKSTRLSHTDSQLVPG
jgi:hypothetical protein